MDWRRSCLGFMKMIGEQTDEWFPELWKEYGVAKNKEEAKIIIQEFENFNKENYIICQQKRK